MKQPVFFLMLALAWVGSPLAAEEQPKQMPAAKEAAALAKSTAAVQQPASSVPATASKIAAPAEVKESRPPVVHGKPGKRARNNSVRSKTEDFRYCLDKPTNAEIAKCAHE